MARISLLGSLSIGVGSMIGAGVFSVLGVVAAIAGPALPVSFAVGAAVAGLVAYSYVALGRTMPTVGGAVTFLARSYGGGVVAGGLNLFQYLSYVITIALYAVGFQAYANTLWRLPHDLWAVIVVVGFTGVNFLGARTMGRAETAIVAVKVAILLLFALAGLTAGTGPGPGLLAPGHWPGPFDVLAGAGVLFVGYEGFGLITNAAANMADPATELARSIYGSIGVVTVVYLAVAVAVVVSVPLGTLTHLGDSALAVAARPTLGRVGFRLVSVAALLSTASAVNATLFGATNVAYQIAKNGHLPRAFDRAMWGRDVEGLFLTAGLVIVVVLAFPLDAVASMGSAAFLALYLAVVVGHLRVRRLTGARATPIWLAALACAGLLGVLIAHMIGSAPSSAIALGATLAASLVAELLGRGRRRAPLASAAP